MTPGHCHFARGTLHSAVIRENAAVFTLSPPPEAQSFEAEITRADDTRHRVAVSSTQPDTGGTLICRVPLDDNGPPLTEIALLVRIDDEWHKPVRDDTACFLHRLLSTDLDKINTNLRWRRRIPDLETRFFAARNSLKILRDNWELRARCIVSVGYQGVEACNDTVVEWCMNEYLRIDGRLDAIPDLEARMSLATFWAHLAVLREDNTMLGGLSTGVRGDVFSSQFPVIAVYNALCLSLLLGGWHLARRELSEALELFLPTNKFFKRAALEFPRHIQNYQELIGITERTYYCQIGRRMAQGRRIETERGFPVLTPNLAWKKGNRLRDDASRKRLGEKYEVICAAQDSGA